MDSLSSFLADLCADVIGSLDVDNISIVHDAPRSPSITLINMNRRAMGMEDFHQPIFLKNERKEKNRWEEEEGPVRNSSRSCPELAVQDPASNTKPARRPGLGSRQCSDSMLLRPRRQPSSPNSPTQPTREGLGGGNILTATRNMRRWASSSSMCCVKEEVMLPQLNGASTSKPMNCPDRRRLTRHLSDSMLAMPRRFPITTKKEADEDPVRGAESSFLDRKKSHRYDHSSLLQNQRSDIIQSSLRTIDPEAHGTTERSLSTQVTEICCGRSLTESQRLQQSGITAISQAETELICSKLTRHFSKEDTDLGNQTKFFPRTNDSLLLLLRAKKE